MTMTSNNNQPVESAALTSSEQALRKIQARLNKAEELAHLGIWELDLQKLELTWSDEVYRIFGQISEEFTPTYEAFLDSVHPEDRDLVNSAFLGSLQENRDSYETEHRIVQKSSGEVRYVYEKCEHTRDASGKIISSVGMVQDITDRKHVDASLEQRTQQVAQLANEQKFILSIMPIGAGFLIDRKIQVANPALDKIFGYETGETLGMNSAGLYPDYETYERIGKDAYALIAGGAIYTVESLMKKKDGSQIWCSIVGKAVNAEKPEEGSIWMVQDITERKLAEQQLVESNRQLRKAREQADSASRSKSEFLSRMSHGLRTPLNAIIGFTQLLEDERTSSLTDDQKDSLHEIGKAGNHLLELINEVLDLARIESGHLSLSLEPLELGELCLECISLLRALAAEQGISVKFAPIAPVRAIADRTKLRQVLLNLISNGIKYNHRDGVVGVGMDLLPDNRLRIRVRDSGPGIDPEFLPRLFQPFERAASVDGLIEGTGIGLVLAKKFTEAMGGTIGVETSFGSGSLFWIELPRASQADGTEISSLAPMVPMPVAVARERSVLYVEDNPANMRLVKKIISGLGGVTLLSAESAEAGLELLRRERPHLILMDINLPGMNGFEALGRMREDRETRGIPIIAVTASAMPDQIRRIMEAGFDDFLTKPINLQRFITVINAQLDKIAQGNNV